MATTSAERGFAAWTFSKTGKLNAWSWHGLRSNKVAGWACVGDTVYMRMDGDTGLYFTKQDQYVPTGTASADTSSAEAITQWLDFGQIGKAKTLTGIDADVRNVSYIEVYVSAKGDRSAGVLADTIAIGANDGGWTYNGEVIPLEIEATEFQLRFVGIDAGLEVHINRVTLYWEPVLL
jgi:hypothetical protein